MLEEPQYWKKQSTWINGDIDSLGYMDVSLRETREGSPDLQAEAGLV